jgi:hypothetical protein
MAPSPFREGVDTVHLDVKLGDDPLAEVFVIDHAFGLVARAVGSGLSVDLEPGVYKVKARLGETTTERVVTLIDDDNTVDLSALDVPSPAPSSGTSQTHEAHMQAAFDTARRAPIAVGDGAEIVIMARRFSHPGSRYVPDAERPARLSLRGAGGELLADLDRDGDGRLDLVDTALGTRVAVDPGTYTLHWAGREGIEVEQSVHAVAGWQTQVFVLTEVPHDGRHRATILMSRDVYEPSADARLVEAARCALADERKVASEDNTRTFAASDDPMLALYGAHLMLVAARSIEAVAHAEERGGRPQGTSPVTFDQSVFDESVGRLQTMLGTGHPDVVALATRASDQNIESPAPVAAPPMLWRSWVLLIDASNRRPDLLPGSTWWPTVKQLHLRPFLAWTPDQDPDGSRAAWTSAVREALADADPADEDAAREEISREMLVPRAVVDEAAEPTVAAG